MGLLAGPAYFAQISQDTLKTYEIESVRFTRRLPVSKEIINVEKDLRSKNLGQDLPILLKNQTSVISTSDAGNGIGYTGLRIRGVGSNSINVMLNGVPYNDSESQGTFFVNIPDVTSSASQIVIQRGVGTSSNGVSAFGASVNILSKNPSDSLLVRAESAYGSFNTYKYAAEVNSGKFWKDSFSVLGRVTHIHSDGYIDRAFSDLLSYNFTAQFLENRTRLRLLAFGGKEKTYQAWNGVDKKTWETQPRFNYSGAIYDKNWENIISFYDNETDNYRQNHFHLLWEQNLSETWNLETTAHYTKGGGYYENYKQDAKFSKYNLPDQTVNGQTLKRTDFIRKKWLDNDFYGIVSTLYGKVGALALNFGAVANRYENRHFGNVTGVFLPQIDEHEYYRNISQKQEMSAFAKGIFDLGRWEFFGDLQFRNISYTTKILLEGDGEGANLDKTWNFFNPKAGLNYRLGQGKLFLSYAQAHREPNRKDLLANAETEPETLHDFEAGIEKSVGPVAISANLFYMNYVNQLVLNGQINDVGEFIRVNSGSSYRTGVELGAAARISKQWKLSGNMTWSENKNRDFRQTSGSGIEDLGNTHLSFSPQLLANVLLSFSPADNFTLSLQNQYVSSQYLDNSDRDTLRLPSYFLSDLQANYLLKLGRTDVNFNFLLNNIFGEKYVNNGFVADDEPYYFSQAGANFLFGVSFKFK